MITSDMIKEGAAAIDVGINSVHDPVTKEDKVSWRCGLGRYFSCYPVVSWSLHIGEDLDLVRTALARESCFGASRRWAVACCSAGCSSELHPRHKAVIISGTEMAKQIQREIQQEVDSWVALRNRRPQLSIIVVGDNPASHMYVRNKRRATSAIGICSELILKPKDVSQGELLDLTDQLNVDPRVSGVLVQLPLPDHVDERTVCNELPQKKMWMDFILSTLEDCALISIPSSWPLPELCGK